YSVPHLHKVGRRSGRRLRMQLAVIWHLAAQTPAVFEDDIVAHAAEESSGALGLAHSFVVQRTLKPCQALLDQVFNVGTEVAHLEPNLRNQFATEDLPIFRGDPRRTSPHSRPPLTTIPFHRLRHR